MKTNIVGIDVSKDSLSAYALVYGHGHGCSHQFANSAAGFVRLAEWADRHAPAARFVMESTGVYHERLTYFLCENRREVSVVVPNKIKHYAKTLGIKTKTDKVDARTIARFGTDIDSLPWQPPSPILLRLKPLARVRWQLKKELSRLKAMLQATCSAGVVSNCAVSVLSDACEFMATNIQTIEDEMISTASQDLPFYERIRNMATVKGVGELTALCLVCETNGFLQCRSGRQLVSYAGLDVVDYQSGTIERFGHISKQGNPHIRHLLYLPALVAAHHGPPSLQRKYARLSSANPTAKKKAIVAVERHLLVLLFTLWRRNEPCNSV